MGIFYYHIEVMLVWGIKYSLINKIVLFLAKFSMLSKFIKMLVFLYYRFKPKNKGLTQLLLGIEFCGIELTNPVS